MCHSALCDPNFYVLLSQIDATGLRRFAPPGVVWRRSPHCPLPA